MSSWIRNRLSEDHGIAMVVVLLAVMVVTVLGASLMISSTRDLESSTSVQRASTALGIAEAGVQHAIQRLRWYGPLNDNISKLVPDDSCAPTPAIPACVDNQTPGQGQWMATDKSSVPTATARYVGNMGTGLYRTSIQAINPIKPPQVKTGVYKIVSTGFDRRDRPTRPGERTVEQFVRLDLVRLPFGLFSQSNVDVGGSPKVMNQSLWTTGDVKFRSSIAFQKQSPADPNCPYPQGCDAFYGWDGSRCADSPPGGQLCPTTVHALGTIYAGNGTGSEANHGPIHKAPPDSGYQNCSYPYDRDSRGGPYSPPGWQVGMGCSTSYPVPPYSSSLVSSANEFPFDVKGPSEDTYQFMKQMAQSTGTFCTHGSTNSIGISASGQPASPHPCERISLNAVPRGFFVLYVEATISNAGAVGIKSGWGTQSVNPESQPCDPNGNFGVIIVRRTNLQYQNNETWWGAAFVPEGEFSGSGTGAEGWFVGTIFAKNIGATGNMKFQLNSCWIDDIAGPWFAVSRLRWHESDR